MAVNEEILRLKFEKVGQAEMDAASAALAQLHSRVTRLKVLHAEGKVATDLYKQGFASLTREIDKNKAVLEKWDAVRAKIDRANGLGGGSGGGGGDRRGAIGRTAFNALNIGQDVAQGGAGAAINNLLQPTLWTDAAQAIGVTTSAFPPMTAAVAAAAAGLVILGDSLHDAGLEWSDLDEVIGELAPVRAAKEAWATLNETVGQFVDLPDDAGDALRGLLSQMSMGTSDLAAHAIGWDEATKAVLANKQAMEARAAIEKQYQQVLKDSPSDAQKDAKRRGEDFGKALANLGGAGGIDAAMKSFRHKDDERVNNALQGLVTQAQSGDQAAMSRLISMFKEAGKDTTALENAQRGFGPDLNKTLNEAGRENQEAMFAEQRAQAEADEKLRLELNQAGRDNVVEGQKEANAKLIAELNKQGQEFEAMGKADFAEGERRDARREAVRAAGEDMGDLEAQLQQRQMDRMFGMNMFAGPRTLGSSDFGASVESSLENPARKNWEVSKEIRDFQKRGTEILERLENRLGRVG